MGAAEWGDVVGCADVGGLNAVDGREVGADVGFGDGGGDAKGGFVGVVGFSQWCVVADQFEDDVGEVNLLTDDAGGDTANARTTGVEGVEPFCGGGDVAVFFAEEALGTLSGVRGVFGGGEGAVWRGEEVRWFLETAFADGEGSGRVASRDGVRRERRKEPPQDRHGRKQESVVT